MYYTAHGFHFYQGAPKKNWLIYYPIEKWLSRFTDKLITITEEDYQLAKARFHCPIFRIHGVGANSEKYHPISTEEQERQKAELGLSGRILINVGELLPNKNQATAIRVVNELLPQFPDIHLLIAGNGPERDNLDQLVCDLGLSDHVALLGYTTQLEKYLQVCDLLLACSYREGLPLNVMEAMLCGKPVVASNNRGHRELIHDDVNGFLVDVDDINGYTEMISKLFQLVSMSQETIRSSAKAYDKYSVEKELIDIYGLNREG